MKFIADLVSTRRYLILKFFTPITLILVVICIQLLFGSPKIGVESYLAKNNASIWIWILTILLLLIAFVIGLVGSTSNGEIGSIEFSDIEIRIFKYNKKYLLTDLEEIHIHLDPTKYKPIVGRNISDGYGNNWITLVGNGFVDKYEFGLQTKDDDNKLKQIYNNWIDNGIEVIINKSRKTLLQKLKTNGV